MRKHEPGAPVDPAPQRPAPRRAGWRRLLRITIWTLVLLVVLAAAGYYRATRPVVLREKLLRALAGIRYAQIDIGQISYSPWDGLEVVDLEIALQPHAPLVAAWPQPAPQSMLRVAHLSIQLDLPALLAGLTRPTAIYADGVALTLIRDAVTGRTNWSFAAAAEPDDDGRRPPQYPVLRLDDADVQIFSADRGQLSLVRRWIVDARGDPETRGDQPGYGVVVEQVSGPGVLQTDAPFPPAGQFVTPAALAAPATEPRAPLASVWLAAGGRTIEAALAWVDLATLDAVLPRDLALRKRELELTGRATVEVLRIRDGRFEAAEVRLDDLSFALPVEAPARDQPPPERFLRFVGFSGRAILERDAPGAGPAGAAANARGPDPARIRITASGASGPATCSLTLAANGQLGRQPADGPSSADDPAAHGPASRAWIGDAPLAELAAVRDWPFTGELRIDGFVLPTVDEHAAFVQSENLPKALRAFFKDFQPRGRMDVRLLASRDPPAPENAGAAPPIRVEGEFIARGTSCRYFRFPYDIEDATGVFRLRDGAVLFEGLSGRHGAGRIRVDGWLAHTRGYAALDLTLTGRSIALDADLFNALPGRYRHLWESAAPIGLSDIQATLHRDEGTPESGGRELQVRVDARLLSASLSAGGGQRLRQVDGAVTVDRGLVTLHDLHGTLDGAGVRLSGTIDGNRPGAADANNLQLIASNVRIDRSAAVGPPGDANTPADLLRFAGRGDVSGRIRGSGGMSSRDAQYVVHIRNGELSSFDGGPPWQCDDGLVVVRGDRQEIRHLRGRLGDAHFEGAGILPAAGGGPPASVEVRAACADMARLIPRLVPTRWRAQADALALSGPGAATIRILPAAAAETAPAQPPGQRAELRVEAAACQFRPAPLPLRDFRATAALDGAGFAIQQATARYGPAGSLQLSGRGDWSGRTLELALTGTDIDLGPEFVSGMPAALAPLVRKLAPAGQADIRLSQLHRAGGVWQVRGDVKLRGASLRFGLPLTSCDGELSGECTIRADGQPDLAAGFVVHRARFAGRPLERIEGQLVRNAGDPWIQLNEVRGRLCDGEVSGFGQVNPATAEYGVTLTLENVRLDQFFPDDPHAPPPVGAPRPGAPPPGRVDGRVFLRGRTGEDASRRGGGELRIRGASFIGTPVLRDVAEARREKTGQALDATDWIELRFVWEGSELKLLRVDLQSRDLRLVGEGRWNLDDDSLVMTLVGANPSNWPRVAVLSELLESAGQELMQYRITGTKKSPRVTAEPLHNLTDPIRRLIEGG